MIRAYKIMFLLFRQNFILKYRYKRHKVLFIFICLGDLVGRIFALSVEGRWFEPRLGQVKD